MLQNSRRFVRSHAHTKYAPQASSVLSPLSTNRTSMHRSCRIGCTSKRHRNAMLAPPIVPTVNTLTIALRTMSRKDTYSSLSKAFKRAFAASSCVPSEKNKWRITGLDLDNQSALNHYTFVNTDKAITQYISETFQRVAPSSGVHRWSTLPLYNCAGHVRKAISASGSSRNVPFNSSFIFCS